MKNGIEQLPKKQTPKPITLQQIEDNPIVIRKGKPATLNQIAWWSFSKRSYGALEAAEAGDFAPIDALIEETHDLVKSFTDHGVFLVKERAMLKDPDGPEAREYAALIALAERNIKAMKKSRSTRRKSTRD